MSYNWSMTRDEQIVLDYLNKLSAAELAVVYDITPRQIQRIVQRAGKQRTISESYRLAIKRGRMKYYHKPEHLKAKRLRLSNKLRFQVLSRYGFTCCLCGATAKDGVRIEIDHIDNNATNNELTNLQVLCNLCNKGKSDSEGMIKSSV